MKLGSKRQVEVYAHGGWWKGSNGQTGQVPASVARKGPLATMTMVANGFGMNGWELTEAISQARGRGRACSCWKGCYALGIDLTATSQVQQPIQEARRSAAESPPLRRWLL